VMHAVTTRLEAEGREPIEETSFVPPGLTAVEAISRDFVVHAGLQSLHFTFTVEFEPGLLVRQDETA
jgi:hypothetical protein